MLSLDSLHQRLIRDFSVVPVMGVELEFYIEGPSAPLLSQLLAQECQKEHILIEKLIAEEGENQFEVSFPPTIDLNALAQQIVSFKELCQKIAHQHDHSLCFDATPYENQPGSGMHVHLNLVNEQGQNLFTKQDHQQDNPITLYVIAGLLDVLPASMVYFAPTEACYLRYSNADLRREGKRNIQTPKTVSWGGNNRSVALRIPESTMQEHTRRIEHRVPSAAAEPSQLFAAILAGTFWGLKEQTLPKIVKSYGNTTEGQYQPIWLPQSLEEALKERHSIFKELP